MELYKRFQTLYAEGRYFTAFFLAFHRIADFFPLYPAVVLFFAQRYSGVLLTLVSMSIFMTYKYLMRNSAYMKSFDMAASFSLIAYGFYLLSLDYASHKLVAPMLALCVFVITEVLIPTVPACKKMFFDLCSAISNKPNDKAKDVAYMFLYDLWHFFAFVGFVAVIPDF